jgi:hypothetical protein
VVAQHQPLNPQHDLGIHRLRTGIAAPQPPGQRGPPEQAQCAHHQQGSQIDKVLRPEAGTKHEKLVTLQVKQHRLAMIPLQPGQAEENQLGEDDQRHADVVEAATGQAG